MGATSTESSEWRTIISTDPSRQFSSFLEHLRTLTTVTNRGLDGESSAAEDISESTPSSHRFFGNRDHINYGAFARTEAIDLRTTSQSSVGSLSGQKAGQAFHDVCNTTNVTLDDGSFPLVASKLAESDTERTVSDDIADRHATLQLGPHRCGQDRVLRRRCVPKQQPLPDPQRDERSPLRKDRRVLFTNDAE